MTNDTYLSLSFKALIAWGIYMATCFYVKPGGQWIALLIVLGMLANGLGVYCGMKSVKLERDHPLHPYTSLWLFVHIVIAAAYICIMLLVGALVVTGGSFINWG